MDDNELQNEQDKREHELALAKLARQRTGWEAFWEVVGEHFIWVFLVIVAVLAAVVQMTTGHKLEGLW